MTAGYAGLFKTRHVPSLCRIFCYGPHAIGIFRDADRFAGQCPVWGVGGRTATALVTGAMAVCAPMLGKLIDRGRAPVALVALGVVQFSCVIGLVVATQSQAPLLMVWGLAFACGRGQSARGWHHALAVEFHRVG